MNDTENTTHTVERDWTTASGLRAVCLLIHGSHRCGYVGLPPEHPWHGLDYSSDTLYHIEVHGGLTYAGSSPGYPAEHDGLWWLGFDCAHSGDGIIAGGRGALEYKHGNPIRTEEYVVAECELLALQLRAGRLARSIHLGEMNE